MLSLSKYRGEHNTVNALYNKYHPPPAPPIKGGERLEKCLPQLLNLNLHLYKLRLFPLQKIRRNPILFTNPARCKHIPVTELVAAFGKILNFNQALLCKRFKKIVHLPQAVPHARGKIALGKYLRAFYLFKNLVNLFKGDIFCFPVHRLNIKSRDCLSIFLHVLCIFCYFYYTFYVYKQLKGYHCIFQKSF